MENQSYKDHYLRAVCFHSVAAWYPVLFCYGSWCTADVFAAAYFIYVYNNISYNEGIWILQDCLFKDTDLCNHITSAHFNMYDDLSWNFLRAFFL